MMKPEIHDDRLAPGRLDVDDLGDPIDDWGLEDVQDDEIVYPGDDGLDAGIDSEPSGTECMMCPGEAAPGSTMCAACEKEDPYANEPEPFSEGIAFDKFMDSILIKEHASTQIRTVADSPLRARAAKVQDRPNNRIRYR